MIGPDFITAGKATFTISGKDARFTFRVSRKDPEPGSRYTQPTYFVGLLSGPDNTSDYRYLGILDPLTGYVRLTRGSKVTHAAPSVKAIQWALPKLWQRVPMPPSFRIHHEGHCGRCGRALTVPTSIETGFGPECADKLGIAAPEPTRPAVSKRFAEAHHMPTPAAAHVCAPSGYELFAEAFEEAR